MTISVKLDSREVDRAFKRAGNGGVTKARFRAANAAGKSLRGELAGILQSIAPAAKTAFRIRARAAHKSQRDPKYTITANRRIPVAQLRAAARQFEKKLRGKSIQQLSIEIDGDKVKFRAARKLGAGKDAQYELLKAGRLPARKVGGVIIGEKHVRSKPNFKSATRRAEAAGMKMLKTEIEKIFKGM